MRLLFVGPQWLGSDSRGLARGLMEAGAYVQIVDSDDCFPRIRSGVTRVLDWATRSLRARAFQAEIKKQARLCDIDAAILYKGSWVDPDTLAWLRARDIRVVLVFPDVSLFSHKSVNPDIVRECDLAFSTKSFSAGDWSGMIAEDRVVYLPHGFDSDLHRKPESAEIDHVPDDWTCDVSFIGTWSPKKERMLSRLLADERVNSELEVKIWGSQWEKATDPAVRPAWQGTGILGHGYVMAIHASKINLGLLIEKQAGASQGDSITSRTFHIPASGGFLLHEDTQEVRRVLEPGEEVGLFDGPDELPEKVLEWIDRPTARRRVARQGWRRCQEEHSLVHRAETMLARLRNLDEG